MAREADRLERLGAAAAGPSAAPEAREAAYRALRAFPGIGPWTAAEVGIRAFGDPDAVSVGDFHLPSVVTWALAGERRGTDERMLELLEPYRGQRGRVVPPAGARGIGAGATRTADGEPEHRRDLIGDGTLRGTPTGDGRMGPGAATLLDGSPRRHGAPGEHTTP